ncbi:p-loop containing nucleoside triphosphate hydrolase [Venustampulla echinocandica]|uniref:RNA helicase n=1 Tax=Venustampulla echinocandica TaxID=2656787 RepID=A0A370TBF0_9HELO|nr:p-loop containing nucleoside triphosphate hydrolase [Venustampulla echinocandica]RDL31369.1 p-loop containing nucleoside triphosphate hydrolase [Venustampulla echinocandica]
MSAWDTKDMSTALAAEDSGPLAQAEGSNPAVAEPATLAVTLAKTPQEHGWAAAEGYNYASYNKSFKEIAEENAQASMEDPSIGIQGAVGGLRPGEWSSNAAVYEWEGDVGDIGPPHPDLEKQLFSSEHHVKAGIQFQNIAMLHVTQEGEVRIDPVRKFEDAGLHPAMLENVKLAGYAVPTPIQQYCLPAVFKGYDIVACAQTGSGKTAAFLIPVLSRLMGKAKKLAAPRPNPVTFQPGITPPVRAEPLVLIVCPNRELATQIFDEARRFCYRTMLRPCVVYGGGPVVEQIMQLAKGCDVLIGTPGRLCDFINRPHVLTLKRLRYMIIDEADEMLHSDWETELNNIMSGGDQEEGNIKYMMFSATFPKEARALAGKHLANDHVRIRVGRAGSTHKNIKQDIVWVESAQKKQALLDLLMSLPPARTIVFVNSRRACDEVDDYLFNLKIPCTAIHSGRTQREREDSIRAFRMGKCPVLIATGVSARGLDIGNVNHIINYDLPSPQFGGIDEYTHRIGRTGRIGNDGLATSFYNDRDADISEILVKTLLETEQPIPDFLTQYIPEGFVPGQGNINTLQFEADSDDGDAEADAGAGAGWGTDDAAPAALPDAAPASADAWGTTSGGGGAGW